MYQSLSTICQAVGRSAPEEGRSRFARSQSVSPARYPSQWISLPQGPSVPIWGHVAMNPSGVDGAWLTLLFQSWSRAPVQNTHGLP